MHLRREGSEIQLPRTFSEVAKDREEDANDFELHAVGSRQLYCGGKLQCADLSGSVDDERVTLMEPVSLFAVFKIKLMEPRLMALI